MTSRWTRVVSAFDQVFPHGSPRRKALHIVAIILMVEGLSVFILYSHVGLPIGLVSFLIGLIILVLLERDDKAESEKRSTPGIRFIEWTERLLGGSYVMMIMGVVLVVLVIVYNVRISSRPGFGDVDTITIIFGLVLIAYPMTAGQFNMESAFALLFLGFVVTMLVVPQALISIGGISGENGIGSWYVHYMLAAPFAATLDLAGIPADSFADMVTIEFQDGSVHTLKISAYCAGLYSFSIFLSAFFAFILVFETMSRRLLVIVLSLGVLTAYLGNIFRMVVIGIVGFYHGLDALYWAHENAGWLIFLGWSSLFWYATLRFALPTRASQNADVES